MTRRIIFVTGGAGFIGSNIIARLAEDPSLDLVACDWLHESDLGKWRNLSKHPIGDFVAPEDMMDWLEKRWRDVELVIHMGANGSTAETNADRIIHQNFGLARDLFRWCTDRQRRFIYASSAATYGDGALGFEDRDDIDSLKALRPLNVHGWSKALFDLFAARQAARDYAPPQWVGLKLFSVYGPNEDHKGAMKSLASQAWPHARDGRAVQLFKSHNPAYEDGGQKRDFVYVRDVAEVVQWLGQSEQVNGIYNLGSGETRTFNELADCLFKAAGRDRKVEYVPMPTSIRDSYRYVTEAKIDRLRTAGYTGAMTRLEDGLADYVGRYLTAADSHR